MEIDKTVLTIAPTDVANEESPNGTRQSRESGGLYWTKTLTLTMTLLWAAVAPASLEARSASTTVPGKSESGCPTDPAAAPEYVPLFKLYSGQAAFWDHLLTTSEEEKDALVAAGQYSFQRIEGYVFKCEQPGTKAIHRWWSPTLGDTFLTTTQHAEPSGYDYIGIEGYIYDRALPPPPGTRPLHRLWSGIEGNHMYTRTSKVVDDPPEGYVYERIEGYMFDNVYGYITVDKDKLLDSGVEFIISGTTIIPKYQVVDTSMYTFRGVADSAWFLYDQNRSTIESELADMASFGATTVRVFAPAQVFEWPKGNFDLTVCEKVDHFLTTAKNNGLRVIFTFNKSVQYKGLFLAEFCAGQSQAQCDLDNPAHKFVMLSDPEKTDFMIERAKNLIQQCQLQDRPEIAIMSFWNEMWTGDENARLYYSPVNAWNQYVTTKYGDVTTAISEWGYTPTLGMSCGNNGDQLCPPNDDEFCTSGPWNPMSIEYRRFADETARNAFQQLASEIRAIDPNHLIGTVRVNTLKGDNAYGETKTCKKTIGYAFNPRIAHGVFDVVGLNSYPWKGIKSPLDDVPPEEEIHLDNFIRLQFMLDFARYSDDGLTRYPVYIQETGYRTECQDPTESQECAALNDLQRDVLMKTAITIHDSHINGMGIFQYRDECSADPTECLNGGGNGLKRLNGDPRPAHAVAGAMMSEVLTGRDVITHSGVTILVNPYSQPLFQASMNEVFDEYKVHRVNGIVTLVTQ